ncbi:phosphoribosylanthranilate isomerase [Streptomyces lavendulocolor]|uniref:phosphoribosylanthranilate isomerase n=1 Tax=Streptomyces lavendulocolor TaxID=67316 RepID=UPI0033D80277
MGIVQIAGIVDYQDACTLVTAGVDWVGIPLRLPVHAQDIDDAEAARITAALPSGRVVLITYMTEPGEIISLSRSLGIRRVQLHGEIDREAVREVRETAPDLFLVRSLVIKPGMGVDQLEERARRVEAFVDMYLTDSHDPATGADGATGIVHDWSISAALCQRLRLPLILAGGLRPDNVGQAIRQVRPAGVDVHTGVEAPDGRKCPELVRQFTLEARTAFYELTVPRKA